VWQQQWWWHGAELPAEVTGVLVLADERMCAAAAELAAVACLLHVSGGVQGSRRRVHMQALLCVMMWWCDGGATIGWCS
jgi:hypothetical protein